MFSEPQSHRATISWLTSLSQPLGSYLTNGGPLPAATEALPFGPVAWRGTYPSASNPPPDCLIGEPAHRVRVRIMKQHKHTTTLSRNLARLSNTPSAPTAVQPPFPFASRLRFPTLKPTSRHTPDAPRCRTLPPRTSFASTPI
ncbi:hypothetical protein K456DRAFT_1161393 [Colletotrichum gloeosporioides 23]|nr:hypothetical protein K456DRAFT_1161393 [Colletotrichum gloeosporioides 23]